MRKGLFLGVGLFVSGLLAGHALARQGHMQAALLHLNQAENQLQHATVDKGGHRKNALALIGQAKAEVQAGIKFDNQH